MGGVLLSLLLAAVTPDLPADPANLFTIPTLADAPAVDGTVSEREWTGAALLPPAGRAADGVSPAHDTRVWMGWRDATLFLALRQQLPANAPAMLAEPDPNEDIEALDRVELRLGKETAIILRPALALLNPGKRKPDDGWTCRNRAIRSGWEAEASIPFSLLGLPAQGGACPLSLRVYQFSRSPEPRRLDTGLVFSPAKLACRFVEAGEMGKGQGVEVELINDDTAETACAVQLVLTTGKAAAGQLDEKQVKLAPNSRRKFRAATVSQAGIYRANASVAVNGQPFAAWWGAFEAPGPVRVNVVPFFLWRNGVFVQVEIRDAARQFADLAVKLADVDGKKILSEAAGRIGEDHRAEIFLSAKDVPAGDYLLLVEARDANGIFATSKQNLRRPPTPAWWRPRESE